MDLDHFINLTGEVVNEEKQSILCRHINSRRLAPLIIIYLVGNCAVVEDLLASFVGQGDQLARHKVVFDFEKSDIFASTADEARVDDRICLETHQIKVAQLSSKQFNFLVLDEILERIGENEFSSLEVLATHAEHLVVCAERNVAEL